MCCRPSTPPAMRSTPPRFLPLRPGKWLAEPAATGARPAASPPASTRISGGSWCTAEDASRFFSFRRDGVTGRMAAAAWIAALSRRGCRRSARAGRRAARGGRIR